MDKIKPIAMWAGGKTKLIKHYESIIPTTGFETYVEPFIGAGAIFLWMKESNPDIKCIINDVNKELIALYINIRDNVDELVQKLNILESSYLHHNSKEDRKELYYLFRKNYWDIPKQDIFSVSSSALLYFLMKTGFNGIWQLCEESKGRFGTPAGLLNQKDRVYDKQNILKWNKILKNVDIRCGSYSDLDIPPNSIIYCDPPYRSSFTTYGTSFGDKEQIELIKFCEQEKQNGNKVFLSNRESGDNFFEDNLPNSKIHKFPITYTAGRRKQIKDGFEAKKAIELLIEI